MCGFIPLLLNSASWLNFLFANKLVSLVIMCDSHLLVSLLISHTWLVVQRVNLSGAPWIPWVKLLWQEIKLVPGHYCVATSFLVCKRILICCKQWVSVWLLIELSPPILPKTIFFSSYLVLTYNFFKWLYCIVFSWVCLQNPPSYFLKCLSLLVICRT